MKILIKERGATKEFSNFISVEHKGNQFVVNYRKASGTKDTQFFRDNNVKTIIIK